MAEILHSKILGNGQPFIILHGFLGMSDNWKTLGKKFSENYQVHLVDQRNHGRSFHSEAFDLELLVEDIHNYIQHYQLENAIILGHSMGGKVAMLFAVSHPNLLQKLIIADIAPRNYPPHHQVILEALNAVDFNIQKSRKEVESVIEKYIPTYGIRQFLLKNVYWKNKGELAFRMHLQSLTDNYDEIGVALPTMSIFEKPTLFLKGENSGYISQNDVALIQAHFTKATVKTVKNAGHWLHAENPTDFYDYVVSFLSQS